MAEEVSREFGTRVRVRFADKLEDGNENGRDNENELNCVDLNSVRSGGGGIKGVRPPPVLAPPPVMRRPVVDNVSSTWDLLKSFAPQGDEPLDSLRGGSKVASSSDEEDVVIERNNVNGGNAGIGESRFFPRSDNHMDSPAQSGIVNSSDGEEHTEIERNKVDGENIGTEESCSSTSNDDDENSSMTLEPIYGISPNGQFKRTINSWQRGELLGSGSFGTVYEGYTDDGFFFAVKEVSLLDQGSQGKQSIYQLEQEISLLSQFEHENIVRYYGTDKDDSKLYIFLELVTKGSLLSLYQKYDLRESQASAYTRQILNGLKYLHEQNVVHRDIKCANILVDVNGSVKLADFGLAKATKLNDVKSCKGTVFWMAPEVVNRKNKGYGLAADIWSLGCTVLEILTRRPPYSHLEGMQALFRIGKGEPPPVSNSLSSDARDFILKCLQVNPSDRPTAGQLLDHPFVKRPLHTFSGPQSPRMNGIRP